MKQATTLRHGHKTRSGASTEYSIWSSMMTRCNNKNSRSYARYGGRGIEVCERWHDFVKFLADVGPRPSLDMSLDRIDNDDHYRPANIRWATRQQQCRNRRSNLQIEYAGEVMTLQEACERSNVSRHTVETKMYQRGMSPQVAFDTSTPRK